MSPKNIEKRGGGGYNVSKECKVRWRGVRISPKNIEKGRGGG